VNLYRVYLSLILKVDNEIVDKKEAVVFVEENNIAMAEKKAEQCILRKFPGFKDHTIKIRYITLCHLPHEIFLET
jgi:hypothetical protein